MAQKPSEFLPREKKRVTRLSIRNKAEWTPFDPSLLVFESVNNVTERVKLQAEMGTRYADQGDPSIMVERGTVGDWLYRDSITGEFRIIKKGKNT